MNTQVHPLGDTVLTQSANKHLITASNKGNVTAECPPFEEVLKLEQLNIISEQERAGRERESKARTLSSSDNSKMLVGINNFDGEENDDDNCTSASFELLDGDNWYLIINVSNSDELDFCYCCSPITWWLLLVLPFCIHQIAHTLLHFWFFGFSLSFLQNFLCNKAQRWYRLRAIWCMTK